jgi:hypothetical protein
VYIYKEIKGNTSMNRKKSEEGRNENMNVIKDKTEIKKGKSIEEIENERK